MRLVALQPQQGGDNISNFLITLHVSHLSNTNLLSILDCLDLERCLHIAHLSLLRLNSTPSYRNVAPSSTSREDGDLVPQKECIRGGRPSSGEGGGREGHQQDEETEEMLDHGEVGGYRHGIVEAIKKRSRRGQWTSYALNSMHSSHTYFLFIQVLHILWCTSSKGPKPLNHASIILFTNS